jgi:hypothetical protein
MHTHTHACTRTRMHAHKQHAHARAQAQTQTHRPYARKHQRARPRALSSRTHRTKAAESLCAAAHARQKEVRQDDGVGDERLLDPAHRQTPRRLDGARVLGLGRSGRARREQLGLRAARGTHVLCWCSLFGALCRSTEAAETVRPCAGTCKSTAAAPSCGGARLCPVRNAPQRAAQRSVGCTAVHMRGRALIRTSLMSSFDCSFSGISRPVRTRTRTRTHTRSWHLPTCTTLPLCPVRVCATGSPRECP